MYKNEIDRIKDMKNKAQHELDKMDMNTDEYDVYKTIGEIKALGNVLELLNKNGLKKLLTDEFKDVR